MVDYEGMILSRQEQIENGEDCNGELILRHAAIEALGEEPEVWSGKDEYEMGLNNQWRYDRNAIMEVPAVESLTDSEQRIFLAAMGREEKVCEKVDKEYRDTKEQSDINLVRVCKEIERKVKKALFQ